MGGLEEKRGPGDMRERPAETGDDEVGRNFSLGDGFQDDKKEGPIALAAESPASTGRGNDMVDRRIGLHDCDEVNHLLLEGDAVVADEVALEAPGILLGHETLGDNDPEVDIQPHRAEQDGEHHQAVGQRPTERPIVSLEQTRKQLFDEPGQPPGSFLARRPQHAGAHHRGGRERDRE